MTTRSSAPDGRPRAGFPVATGYPRAGRARIVAVPDRRYLAVDGSSAPGGAEFQDAMGALYGTAYSLLFLLRGRGLDAHIAPPECLWERLDGAMGFSEGDEAFDPEAWRWTLMIGLADAATEADVASAISLARRRRPSPVLDRLRILPLHEGVVVEAMHVGPYVDEPATIARMRETAETAGLRARGPHHEIYLGDPRRCAPQNLRTVLRQPLASAA